MKHLWIACSVTLAFCFLPCYANEVIFVQQDDLASFEANVEAQRTPQAIDQALDTSLAPTEDRLRKWVKRLMNKDQKKREEKGPSPGARN